MRQSSDNGDGLESDLLGWEFYEKGTASKRVIHAQSAFTWRQKLVMLGMEAFRRLWNSLRQLSLTAKFDLLKTFIYKLRRSGYGAPTIRGVIESGLGHYFRKLSIDLRGDKVSRRRARQNASQDWFSRKRGGQDARDRKDNGWRSRQLKPEAPEDARVKVTSGPRSRRQLPQQKRSTPTHRDPMGASRHRIPRVTRGRPSQHYWSHSLWIHSYRDLYSRQRTPSLGC